MEERLQKTLARAGVASRRKAEEMIVAGRVKVNGLPVKELGYKVDPDRDEIRVDGQQIIAAPEHTYVMLHKPEGYVTTTADPEGRPTVMSLVKKVRQRVFPVGRLDYDTSGLLLITSDGDLTRFLTHPSSHVPKTYQVKIKGKIGPDKINELKKGPNIGGKKLLPAEVKFLRNSKSGLHTWIQMTIVQGRTRQIRKMVQAVGHYVIKLKRISVGPLKLGDLPPGEFRFLDDKEIASLKRMMKAAEKKN